MTSAAATASLPTRSEIEEWSTSHLSDAATSWRSAATASEGAFDEHRQNIASPGGTTWEGDAKDAALDRVTKDVAVVGRQSDVLREAADLAENGAHDIKAAKDKAVEAITAAENDGFSVGEDLSVTDTREYDINTIAERNRALAEHAEDIRWAAEQLMQADKLVGDRLQAKAADLEGIRFEGEGEGRGGEPTVQLVDNKVRDKSGEDRKDESGDKPAEQASGQVGPFAVPKSVEDAAKKSGLKPDEKPATTGDAGGDLGDLLGANDTPEDKPEDGQAAKPGEEKPAGLPPVLSQVPPPPDKATIDRQAAKVESARQALAAAQAKLDDAAGQGYMQGAGAGPSRDDTNALSQAVFDARAELTEQTRVLNELNHASAAHGGPTAPVAPLPENADVQGFPKEPPVLERGAGAFAEGMKDTSKTIWDATMPDVSNMYDVATDFDGATPEQKRQAAIDAAGMVPLPGAKLFGEGIEHGLDALGAAGRHVDDAPTPHVDVETPSAGHAPVDAPHAASDAPVEHHVPSAETGHVATYGVEDASALLEASENTGGHLIERHVGQTVEDLSARLDATRLPVVSSFGTVDEAASAVSAALQHNRQVVDEWISSGAVGKVELDAPFSGGEVLRRGSTEAVGGSGVRVVLKGDGTGGWYVLTGFPTP
ncbi:RNase A-like domain-containing protein [Mycolicibacterium houstonense]|uniref:RNase A-like domain-containing protein n=1 Tax=Mycolicibacterium houstonense TaxID=146021 RepID=UPI003F99B96C